MKIKSEIITSRNNPLVKQWASLADKKHRERTGVFIIEGEKLALEAITAGLPIVQILISETKFDDLGAKYKAILSSDRYENSELICLSEAVFEKISTEKAPQGVICVIKHLDFFRKMDIIYKEEFFLKDGERAIALCSVRDPGNLGSVIRSAVAFGVDHIVLSADCADIYNPKTIRSAMGGMFRVRVTIVSDMVDFVKAAIANGRRVFSAELREGARSVADINLNSSDLFLIGNEGHGIPTEISAISSGSVYIPISSKMESLNASVAAAVLMWEQSRIR